MRLLRVVATLLFAAAATAQPIDPKAIDRLMNATIQAWRIPGAAVAVVQNDRVVYAQGYGVKEVGGKDPVTADTVFQLASTTKAFTSTSLAMLVAEGKLSFDDPVRKHVEYFHLSDACADSAVTIRDIVSHRSGLSRHDQLWDDTPLSREEVIRSMAHVALSKPFRTAYQYQNITFITAGEAVAHASGVPWDEFVRTRIFQPLGMTSTFTADAEWEAANHASGHRYDAKAGVATRRPLGATATVGAAGAIKSTARDMGNWVRFHLAGGTFNGKELVAPEHLAETKAPQTVMRVEGLTAELYPETNLLNYAMGWNVQDYRGELLVSHGGALNGFRTRVDLLPKRNAGFVVMINAERGYSLLALQNTLADMLLGKPSRDWNAYYLAIDRKLDAKADEDRQKALARRIPDTKPTRALQDYTGTYVHPGYGTATIALSGDQLVLQWNRMKAPLTHFHYDVFRGVETDFDFEENVPFTLDEEQKVNGLTLFGQRFQKR
jgi:CubicO group peptidase (beta-lactamase class C family)